MPGRTDNNLSADVHDRPAWRLSWRPARWAFLFTLSVAAFAVLALFVAHPQSPPARLDRWVSDQALSFARSHPAWKSAAEWVTTTGSLGVLGPLVILLGLALLLRRYPREALFVWAAMLLTVLARDVVVALIARPRPVHRLVPISGFSFPSGHSTASATVAVLLILVVRPLLSGHRSRVALTVLALLWAFAVGTSRVALVVHWPTDVLGAWLFVTITMSGMVLLFHTRGRTQPVARVEE